MNPNPFAPELDHSLDAQLADAVAELEAAELPTLAQAVRSARHALALRDLRSHVARRLFLGKAFS
jgi:hypothetical protein